MCVCVDSSHFFTQKGKKRVMGMGCDCDCGGALYMCVKDRVVVCDCV